MRRMIVLLAAAAAALSAPASAADFSFTGAFLDDDDVAFFDFTANGTSTITLRSYSYAGGTNVAGIEIAAGGFDAILTLFDLATGLKLSEEDDAVGVPPDPVTGAQFDVNYSQTIAAGSYRVALSQFDNFGGGTLSEPFRYTSAPTFTQSNCGDGYVAPFCDVTGASRTGNWAFDILGVDTASPGNPVPEPGVWAMLAAGFGAVGGLLRSRRRATIARA